MSTSEKDLAGRIVHRLDQGLAEIDPRTLAKLRTARESALEAMQPQTADRLAWAGIASSRSSRRYFNLRHLVPVATLALTVSGMVYWQQLQHIEDPVDIDAQLLSGDLPIDAYLDTGLDTWLKR